MMGNIWMSKLFKDKSKPNRNQKRWIHRTIPKYWIEKNLLKYPEILIITILTLEIIIHKV